MKIQMNVLREILRLTQTTDFSDRRVADILKVAPNTVRFYRKKLKDNELSWSHLQSLDDTSLESKLCVARTKSHRKVMPDYFSLYERKIKNKYLTLEVLHEEYRAIHKDRAYSYSQFTYYYRKFLKKLDISMRLRRYPGEAMFIDYTGTLIPWKNLSENGRIEKAQVFVAVLGWSSYTFACASRSQKLEDFIDAHVKAFKYFGGVTEALIPDNLKSAVTKPGRDPELNRTYQELAKHYGTVVLPARVRKPQDKASAEQGVLFVTRWITAKLLERQFFSIDEINQAITELLPKLNDRQMRNYSGSRNSRFQENEKPALRPLPAQHFEYAEWVSSQKVAKDYHVKVRDHWYSVPFQLVAERVEARTTRNVVEVFHKNKRVATHMRRHDVGGFSTDKQHLAPQHLAYSNEGLDLYIKWAHRFGPATESVVRAQYDGKRNSSMIANKACSSLKALARIYDETEFEAACARAMDISSPTLKSVRSILRTGLFKLIDDDVSVQMPLPLHGNLRGAQYYQQGGI